MHVDVPAETWIECLRVSVRPKQHHRQGSSVLIGLGLRLDQFMNVVIPHFISISIHSANDRNRLLLLLGVKSNLALSVADHYVDST